MRNISHLGVDVRIGIGPTITVAATASAQITGPGGVLAIARTGSRLARSAAGRSPARDRTPPDSRASRRHPYGRTARRCLLSYRATSAGQEGRPTRRRPRPRHRPPPRRPGTCRPPPPYATTSPATPGIGAVVRGALLDLVVRLGLQLRRRGQAAREVTLTLRFAGGTVREKARRLPGPSGHEEDLRTLAYQLMDAAGPQRARLTGIGLRAENLLIDAGQVTEQIGLDGTRGPGWSPRRPWTASGRSSDPAPSGRPPSALAWGLMNAFHAWSQRLRAAGARGPYAPTATSSRSDTVAAMPHDCGASGAVVAGEWFARVRDDVPFERLPS
ncbi:hypothetical protein [Streptomyces sp. NPDC048521]|uniref:DinB/UmuC family translesion DNA polymerase n=1 Tax=Streptomyces sp. NPDC048521 TaxID=3365566 RepID=UPI00371376CD